MIRSTSELARYVGLARTTVSRVINRQPGLRPKTIARVQQAIEETGFIANAYALHLRGKRTATVGVCMETLLTPTAVYKAASLQRHLRKQGYTCLIELMEAGRSRELIRRFLSLRVEAIVFIGHFSDEEIAPRVVELKARGTPALMIDQVGVPLASSVSLDRARGMRELTEHLIGLGHRRFGLLGITGAVRSVQSRLEGIAEALTAAGLDPSSSLVAIEPEAERQSDFEYGRALATRHARDSGRPTAFLALNDEIAIGAMHGLQEAGLRVPSDASVAGFNNQDLCLMPTPRLTSVDQQIEATIDAAAELLLAEITDPNGSPQVRMIEPLLVLRDSIGPAPR